MSRARLGSEYRGWRSARRQGQNPEAPGAREHEARCLAAMSRAMAIESRGTAALSRQEETSVGVLPKTSGLETKRKRRIREEVRGQGDERSLLHQKGR